MWRCSCKLATVLHWRVLQHAHQVGRVRLQDAAVAEL